MNSELTLVIPAFNEAESLARFLPELLARCEARGWQIIIVDDGSADSSASLLQQPGISERIRLLRHKLNQGYGAAIKTGILHAETEYVLTMDADGQHVIDEIDRMLQAIQVNDADMVVGRRAGENGGWYRALGKRIIRFTAGLLMPIEIKDINSGFKLYRTALVKNYLPLCPNGMPFSDVITLAFIKRRRRVVELEIQIQDRIAGVSKISTRTAFETIQELINITMLFNPLNLYLPLAFALLLLGIAWGLPILLQGRGVSVGSMLLLVAGLILMLLGFLAEQIAALRLGMIELVKEPGLPAVRPADRLKEHDHGAKHPAAQSTTADP